VCSIDNPTRPIAGAGGQARPGGTPPPAASSSRQNARRLALFRGKKKMRTCPAGGKKGAPGIVGPARRSRVPCAGLKKPVGTGTV